MEKSNYAVGEAITFATFEEHKPLRDGLIAACFPSKKYRIAYIAAVDGKGRPVIGYVQRTSDEVYPLRVASH